MSRVNHPSPAKIIGQVMSSDPMKPDHPLLESAAIGVHVLHVVNLADHFDSCGQIYRAVGDTHFASRCTQRPTAVGAKHDITCQQRLEYRANVRFIRLVQNKIGCAAGAITANQHGNLLLGQTSFRCFAATLMGFTRHVFFLSLKRFKEVGFIHLSNANQALSLLRIGQCKKTMAPEKRRVAMHFADSRAVAYTLTISHLLGKFKPFVLMPQSGQWRSSQCIEGRMACGAPVTLQARCRTPARNAIMTTLWAQRFALYATFNQCADCLNVLNLVQAIHQNASLMRRQFFKFCRQNMKFFGFHRSTYPIDWYDDSIDHYLTVT